jgi:hypothetical protein
MNEQQETVMVRERTAVRFERPVLKRSAPNRGAANFYRSASDNPHVIGGISLDNVEDAFTSAVRMAYRVAEAQIDRTARLGQRLRQAGDRAAGPGSERKALDATEQLIFRSMMAGLSWFEGLAADDANPIKRLAVAQYRVFGALLGLTPSAGPSVTPSAQRAASEQLAPPARADVSPARPSRLADTPLRIKHKAKKEERRAVEVRSWALPEGIPPGDYALTFHGIAPGTVIEAVLVVDEQTMTLVLESTRDSAAGVWKAAICDDEGLQLGHIEIAL